MKLYTKEELIVTMRDIFSRGWHRSVKKTKDSRNDGAVGNTLEKLLGIKENNLPIPNAREWELKGQRLHSSSLITLKHVEPSPTAAKIVSSILLPKYGWKHKQAGIKYPRTEMSFRSTTSATNFTNRGFSIIVDRKQRKVRFVFDPSKVDKSDQEIAQWFETVVRRVGIEPISPEPYWGLDDLEPLIGTKMKNCFYVVADTRIDNRREYFKFEKLFVLSGFSFSKFLDTMEEGDVLIDFDARTHHNHGTKFRLKQGYWTSLYSSVIQAI